MPKNNHSDFFLTFFSSGQVEYSFDNPAESYSCQSLEVLAQSPNRNIMKSVFSQNLFFPKCFFSTVKCSFGSPAENLWGKVRINIQVVDLKER